MGRRLKCLDPRIVKKYNEHLANAIDTQQCLIQLEEVYKEGATTLMQEQLETLEALDKNITTAKLAAERQYWKIHAGKIPWTTGLTIVIYKLLYWQGIKEDLWQYNKQQSAKKAGMPGSRNLLK